MTAAIVVFALVYVGMLLGGFPRLALDRTGVALLGLVALLVLGVVTPDEAWLAIDVRTIALLFGLMIVSAQLEVAGFYARVTERIGALDVAPPRLLAVVIAVAGVLSAVLANDVVCLAMAPLLVAGCARRGLDPVPFLLALACASNVGSAATLIGNPQNMLIGQALGLSFAGYLGRAGVPTLVGLVVVHLVVVASVRGRWTKVVAVEREAEAPPPYAPRQATKGLVATIALSLAFLATSWPRETVALGVAGALLVSRRTSSRALLAKVDGQLLVLFVGLFVVNHALAASGASSAAVAWMREAGFEPALPANLFAASVVLSNLVSNVPAVMLLLPLAPQMEGGVAEAGALLALASTLAGNLLLVGSIANLIVVDQAARLGVRITWAMHARVGVPVGLATLAIAGAWLALTR